MDFLMANIAQCNCGQEIPVKCFGISPFRYKKNPVPVPYFIPYKMLFTPLSKKLKKEKKKI